MQLTLKEKIAQSLQISHLKGEIKTRQLAIKSMPNFASYHLSKIEEHKASLAKLGAI